MSQWQPEDRSARQPVVPQQFEDRMHVQPHAQYPAQYQPRQPAPQYRAARKAEMTAAGQFWYYLGCVPMAAMYFCKVPCKKALADAGMCEMTAAEKFWYVLMCIPMGAGYFCKLPVAKALSEAPQFRRG